MTHEIFISYSAKDVAIAEATCQALEKDGLSCWIAPRDITPGVKFAEAILDGINQCRIFLLILSATSNNSPQVEMEVDRAASKNKFILSFRLDQCALSKSLEYYLGNRHWLEASNPPSEQDFQALINAVRQLRPFGVSDTELPPKVKKKTPPPVKKRNVNLKKQALPVSNSAPLNPFTFGNPIKDPGRFYGRKAEIRQIVNRLLSSAHESTSIVGERRIGKTSLLKYLSNPEVTVALGLELEQFCLVYVDFQGLTDITPTRFWKRVLGMMSQTICDENLKPALEKLIGQETFDLFDLEDLFQVAGNKGMTTVLLMDEFEYVTQNPNFKSDFFGGLRSLAIHHGVALIPATRRELVDLCHSDEIKGSPFFNIFVNVVLRPFSRIEVDELLDGYTRNGLTSQEKDFVWNLGGGYPQFLQTAGYYLLDGKMQGLAGNELDKYVSENFDQQSDSHYSYLWSHCSESEKITLLIILTLGWQELSEERIPNLENLNRIRARNSQDLISLGKRGLVDERDGVYSLFSASFARWIQLEIATPTGEEESQQTAVEWLASGNWGSLKETKRILPKFKKKYWPVVAEVAKDLTFAFAAAGAIELIRMLR